MPVDQNEILSKAVATLRADAGLLALTGDINPAAPEGKARVYNHVPQDEDQPYVLVVWESGKEGDTKDSTGFEGRLNHEVVSTHHGDRDVLKMQDAIIAAYELNPIVLVAAEIICFQFGSGSTPVPVSGTHRATFFYNVHVDDDGVSGATLPPIAGGPVTITKGRAPAAIVFVPATKAFVTPKLIVNPNNNDSVKFNTYFDPLGNPTGANPVTVTFKTVLGSPFIAGVSVLDVRIEATIAGTLANLIAGLNDPGLIDAGLDKFNDTWTATNPSSTILKLEQDFTGPSPNTKLGFTVLVDTTGGAWEDGSGNPATDISYAGGADSISTDATVQAFELEIPSGGPAALIGLDDGFTSRIKSGTHEPESAVTITGDAIILDAVFSDAASTTGVTYRQIVISPTEDAVTGSATVSWTWNGTPFEVLVTKT